MRALRACEDGRLRSVRSWLVVLLALSTLIATGCRGVTADIGENDSPAAAQGEPALKASAEYAANGPIGDSTEPRLKLLRHTLALVRTNYYDPSRVNWRKMMANAFDALQSQIVEVVSDFDRPLDEIPSSVQLRVNTRTRTFDLSKITELSDVHEMSIDVATFLLATMREEMKVRDLEYLLINGMLDTLDPHSVLLTPEVYEDMQTSHGGFGGLGIVIGIRDDELTVISPIEGTPASRAGLRSSDKIMQIGEESTINMALHEAVDRLRGEVGTAVSITIMRKSWTEPRVFTIVRDHIKIRSLITHALPKEKLAYVKVKSFEKNTSEDIRAKLVEMRKEMGEIKGLILDLRYNAGGLLTQAIKVADLFLDKGHMIVASEGVGGTAREEEFSSSDAEPTYPIIVIVNAGSASASEIVAGALKNHDRALIIGDKTFGKGSVQILRDNDDGSAIKLTIAQYLTPGDISIQGIGIAPDVHVVPVLVSEKDGLDLFASENVRREGNLELALHNDKAREGDDPLFELNYLYAEDPEDKSDEEYYEDFEIRLAKRLIATSSESVRKRQLKAASALLDRVVEEETAKIVVALGKMQVDWSAPESVEVQPFDVRVEQGESGDTEVFRLKAGDTTSLRVSVTNRGTKPISRLYALTASNNPVFDDRELVFGKVAPGATTAFDLEVKVPKGGETRQDTITLAFADATKKVDHQSSFEVITEGLPRPEFAYSYQVDDRAQGNGDGLLQANESVELIVHVHNVGEGSSDETLAFMRSNSGAALYLGKGRDALGPIGAGEMRRGRLAFDVKGPKEQSDFVDFDVTIYDSDFGSRVVETVELPVYDTKPTIELASGRVRTRSEAVLFGGASPSSLPIGKLEVGGVFERDARSPDGSMVRVVWSEGEESLFGWVLAAAVEPVRLGDEALTTPVLTPAHSAPRVAFDPMPHVLRADKVEIAGAIADDGTVADYRVYVWHRDGTKASTQKLDFGVGGRDSKRFAVDVPLRKGVNRITVVARDDQKLERSATMYVERP